MHLKSKNGYDLHLSLNPKDSIEEISLSNIIRIHPDDFNSIKPKLLIQEGDAVKRGQPLFYDKNNPDVMFVSPISGKVNGIIYRERRLIASIDLVTNNTDDIIEFKKYNLEEIKKIDNEKIRKILCTAGAWPYFRKRPFSIIPSSKDIPESIFVSTSNTAPYEPSVKVIHDSINFQYLQAGICAIHALGKFKIHFTLPINIDSSLFKGLDRISLHSYEGPHPSGNVGYHISKIHPIKDRDSSVWYIDIQDLASIGRLLLTGVLDNKKIISIGGHPDSSKNIHIVYLKGTIISHLLNNSIDTKTHRIISGNPLTGTERSIEDSLSFYHNALSIINNVTKRQFLGWISPGFFKYSLSRTFLSSFFPKKNYQFNTNTNGDLRTIVPLGIIEKMCNLDIMPTMLLKSIISRDIDMMEKLGIYECSSEDFALCSFVDPSKMDISSIIQEGLDYAEKEG